jgi:hypothetical protein
MTGGKPMIGHHIYNSIQNSNQLVPQSKVKIHGSLNVNNAINHA